MDQKKGNLFWVSCKRNTIGSTVVNSWYSQQLYSTRKEVRALHLDWVRGTVLWLEDKRLVVMSVKGGQAKELLQLAGEVMGNIAFDLKDNSLLWNSKLAGCFLFLSTKVSKFHFSLQPCCTVLMFWLLCRFDDLEFAAGEEPPCW